MGTRVLFIFLSLFALVSSVSYGQNTAVNVTIKGQVVDSVGNEPIPYATVSIADKATPDERLKAIPTDLDGHFQLSMTKKGEYLLFIEFLGKHTYVKPLSIGSQKVIDLALILMQDTSESLSEVVISATKPLVQVDLDKIVYSMEDDPEAKTNNVLDMLKKVPMVTVDGEENIQLKGSSSFVIYMNGKPSNMITNNPKDVLRSMPANTVKEIKVITDPGAKYDAEGVTGIIDIITHSSSSMGGYTATLNGRVDDRGGYGLGGNLMLKYGKVGFTGYYNYYDWKQPRGNYSSFRDNFDATNDKYLYENGSSKNNGNGQFGSGELSFEIDTLNLINIGFSRYQGNSKSFSDRTAEMEDINHDMYYQYDINSESKGTYGGTDLTADYQRTFKKKDQLLTASYRYSFNPDDSESGTIISDAIGSVPAHVFTNNQFSDADMNEHTFQVDFTTPFAKVHNLEVGAKYIIRLNQSTSGMSGLNEESGEWVSIDQNGDRFKHEQDILAAYAGYSAKFNKWGVKTGLRYEATWLDAQFPLVEAQNFKVDYSNLVPSATVTYQLKPAQNIRLGYNMRISRPGIWQLNPYTNSTDPQNISMGNPELDAVKSHSINANYGYFTPKVNLNLNMSYNFDNNGIERISTMDNNVKTTTYYNIGERKNLRMSAYINWSPNTKIRLYTNMSGGYADIKTNADASITNGKLSNSGFTGSIFFGGQYSFPKSLRFYVNGGYFSPGVNLQTENSSFTFYSFSVSKGFMNDRLNFRVSAQNPFTKNRDFKTKTTSPDFYSESISTNHMRNFGVSVSFRFGEMKQQIKKIQRSISNDDTMGSGESSGQGQTGGGGGM